MSRIFDALQRAGTEQSGIEYPDVVSVATQVFEAVPDPSFDAVPADLHAVLNEVRLANDVVEISPAKPAVLETPAVASIPSTVQKSVPDPLTEENPRNALPEFPSLHVNVPSSSRLVFFNEPDSLAAEKFRFLGVRLRQVRQNRPLKKVLVTSSIPEEGKSMVSANIATVLARRKEKVLLLEGDLRRPVQAKQFSLGKLAGLGEWLQSGSPTVSNIYRLEGPGFWLMPAGDPPANPLELMQSGRLSLLMKQLVTMFDWIVVDSPPILPLADTTVWARVTDGTLLVAREGITRKTPLQRGLEILKKSDLLGIVLNSCSHSDHANYYQRYTNSATK